MEILAGNIVDVVAGRLFAGRLWIENGRILRIEEGGGPYATWLVPGLVDPHVHIESSLLVPSEFARLALRHGTVATVSDPHEIANVLGIAGIDFMIQNGRQVPFKFHFGAPSCVPATDFESAGARLDAAAVAELLARPEIRYLSEMMNYPGVVLGDPEVAAKLAAARRLGKPVDGHAPGLRGEWLEKYVAAGIGTDHETLDLEEGREKIRLGMKVLIREGSAARNFDDLLPLVREAPESCMFCADDIHPDDLEHGHLDRLLARAVAAGVDPVTALRCVTLNPVRHYGLPVGLLQAGDPADILELDDLVHFRPRRVWVDGVPAMADGQALFERRAVAPVNRFDARPVSPADLAVSAPENALLDVIQVHDRQLVTGWQHQPGQIRDGRAVADPARDLLKLVVLNRYAPRPPAVAFITGFGLARGAIASSVAHDSHNIVAVGADDAALAAAINAVIADRGGLALVDGPDLIRLPLPVAGLMSPDDGVRVARRYAGLNQAARALGSPLSAPFMSLSFMALLVIPELKLSDRGLFDGRTFKLLAA